MNEHLLQETLVELATGGGPPSAARHAEGCAACAARLAELSDTLALAARAEIPEPPGAYWEAFHRSVERRIAEEPRRGLVRWLWLLPVAAAAALVFTVVSAREADRVRPPATIPSWSALPPLEEDAGTPLLEALVGTDEEAAAFDQAHGLGTFLGSLSDEESVELADALSRQQQGAL